METDEFKHELEIAIRAKVPVIAIITPDEEKSLKLVKKVCEQGNRQMGTWKITDEKTRGTIDIKAVIHNCSRFENRRHILIAYDLCDLIKSDTSVKRAIIDGIPEITGNGCTIITFTETNPGMSMIYNLSHNAGLSEQEAMHIFDEAIEGITTQKNFLEDHKNDPELANKYFEFSDKYNSIIEQYNSKKHEISKIFHNSKLNRYQVETIVAKCIVRGEISGIAVEKEFKFL